MATRGLAFRKKSQERATKNAEASKAKQMAGHRDPYALFKEAILSEPDAELQAAATKPKSETDEYRAEYSSKKMKEHQRVNKHLTEMIKMRMAAIEALPKQLRSEAQQQDLELIPIERRVFTDTAPIPNFQDLLTKQSLAE